MAGARRLSGSGRRGSLDDAEFRRLVDEAKAQHNLSDVVAKSRNVTRAGAAEFKALCAFHQERSPSMQVNDAKGTFYCFGCGASGDIVRYVMLTEGLAFMDAMRWLNMAELPAVDPAQRAKAAAEDAALRARAIADAQTMWNACVEPAGTAAETYLRRERGLVGPIPAAVRFGRVPTARDENGNWKRPYPAMVLACRNSLGELTGVQRVFLRDDGRGKRWGKRSKLSLGRPLGAAVQLGPSPDDEIIMCEGPEDGLTLAQEMPERPVWIALGTAMMPEMVFPPSVRRIVLAGQNDAPGKLAVDRAALALSERGLIVRPMFPRPEFKDWNDQLRGIRQ